MPAIPDASIRAIRVSFWVEMANGTVKASERALHARQIQGGGGFTLSSSMAARQVISGTTELPSKRRSRNLSIGSHSCKAPLRNATTTLAKPASARASCDAVLRASPGSMMVTLRAQLSGLSPSASKDRWH